MTNLTIETPNLELVLSSPEAVRQWIRGMSPAERAQVSAEWLARVEAATSADPWIHGFEMRTRQGAEMVGSCAFKGPPTVEGVVEIAYTVEPDHCGNGYATEAAQALVTYALERKEVRLVRAHTLPESNASTRVLAKCGFSQVGEVVDPEDGLVWRWECRSG